MTPTHKNGPHHTLTLLSDSGQDVDRTDSPEAYHIERLGREIASSAKSAQEDPPEFLRRRIAELEKGSKHNGSGAPAEEVARLQAEAKNYRAAAEPASARVAELESVERAYRETADALRALVSRLETNDIPQQAPPAPEPSKKPVPAPALKPPSRSPRDRKQAFCRAAASLTANRSFWTLGAP